MLELLINETLIKIWTGDMAVPLTLSYSATDPMVVLTPWYKNFVQSCIESDGAYRLVELYLGLLYHSTAGLSWQNIQIF